MVPKSHMIYIFLLLWTSLKSMHAFYSTLYSDIQNVIIEIINNLSNNQMSALKFYLSYCISPNSSSLHFVLHLQITLHKETSYINILFSDLFLTYQCHYKKKTLCYAFTQYLTVFLVNFHIIRYMESNILHHR